MACGAPFRCGSKGAATTKIEFGDPVDTHGYELCIYSGGGLVSNSTLPAGSLWSESQSGFKYRDPAGGSDGIQTVLLKAGADQKAKIIVKGRAAESICPIWASSRRR